MHFTNYENTAVAVAETPGEIEMLYDLYQEALKLTDKWTISAFGYEDKIYSCYHDALEAARQNCRNIAEDGYSVTVFLNDEPYTTIKCQLVIY